MYNVSVVKYEKPYESLVEAVELCGGIKDLAADSKVVIKPNLVLWHEGINFPKYGVLTTARLIQDMVKLLSDHGVIDITIIEGVVEEKKSKVSLLDQAIKGLGLDKLKDRYGVKFQDVMKSPFTKIPFNDKKLLLNTEILEADAVINMPVLKTHTQAMVSLGIKNMKGILNTSTRKIFHSPEPDADLDFYLAKFPDLVKQYLTVIDGIYTLELGPLYAGLAHRSNVIVASKDLISADKVGTKVLGIDPAKVKYLATTAKAHGRPTDLSDIEIKGNVDVETELKPHACVLAQNKSGDLPVFLEMAGVKGLRFSPLDNSICTYCTHLLNYLTTGILTAKNLKEGFDNVEILYGKRHKPTPGYKHTILAGQCQVKLNKDNPDINHCILIKGCPPNTEEFIKAYAEAGIQLRDNFLEWIETTPETVHMKRYLKKPQFDDSFFQVD